MWCGGGGQTRSKKVQLVMQVEFVFRVEKAAPLTETMELDDDD